MQWDLLEEHSIAYEEEICKKINELTDLFDIILDEIKIYPYMLCVDVFPYTECLEIEIPEHIQNYYRMFFDEEYKNEMQKKFNFILHLEKRGQASVYEVLNNVFDEISSLEICEFKLVKTNINKVANTLLENIDNTFAKYFKISKHDLKILQEVYLGILFYGWIIKCGNYAILILLGTNE